ncbi:hypothetical protein IWZ00DRAFT_369835 [Phyllosticta capitalensis]|uniref:Uncharacterized protein n=1 Tax=Phyllosticta capitalensis TaxID=121624 RepID=A0ABR1YDX7_9PEZI
MILELQSLLVFAKVIWIYSATSLASSAFLPLPTNHFPLPLFPSFDTTPACFVIFRLVSFPCFNDFSTPDACSSSFHPCPNHLLSRPHDEAQERWTDRHRHHPNKPLTIHPPTVNRNSTHPLCCAAAPSVPLSPLLSSSPSSSSTSNDITAFSSSLPSLHTLCPRTTTFLPHAEAMDSFQSPHTQECPLCHCTARCTSFRVCLFIDRPSARLPRRRLFGHVVVAPR